MLISIDDFDIKKVKLIIWDLDNTFWQGTIAEEGCTPIESNISLVKTLSEKGIVNSICSKNDYEVCKKKLLELGCWEYFVFPSIDWTFKGTRVCQIIKDMALRPANVLFLDDENLNLQNVLTIEPEVMCSHADDIVGILEEQSQQLKTDKSLSRLNQYKVLETKWKEKKNFSNDKEFLESAGIQITIGRDCLNSRDRILELINRSNQLNFTKKRLKDDELYDLLTSSLFDCAYISCSDKYGQYGIVGFYAVSKKEHRLEHFVFSCRTLGMGIEQYIYAKLNYPQLQVVGKTVSELNCTSCPDWIEEVRELAVRQNDKDNDSVERTILVKGPCDIAQIVPFFSENTHFVEEMTYVSREKTNVSIEAHNHTSQIVLIDSISDTIKTELLNTLPFVDSEYFNGSIFKEYHDYVIISMLVDYSLGMYKNRKNQSLIIAFNQYDTDITDRKNWDKICEVEKQFTTSFLEEFSKTWEYIGRISEEKLIDNLNYIRKRLPKKTKIILLTGSEIPFVTSDKERVEFHKKMNSIVRSFCKNNEHNMKCVDVNRYIKDENSFHDTVNHYKKIVYYSIAKEIQEYINQDGGGREVTLKGEDFLKQEIRKQKIDLVKRKVKSICKKIFK